MESEDFVLQSLKSKMLLLEIFTAKSYFKLVKKQIEFYLGLMEVLRGSVPFSSFLGAAAMDFSDTITSKSNVSFSLFRFNISARCPFQCLFLLWNYLKSKTFCQ